MLVWLNGRAADL